MITMPHALPHAVSRLRTARLARSSKPFLARGGPRGERCAGCRLVPSHCLCALRPAVPTRAGMCLIMADIEPLKPSNTGWLVADVVADTFAFGWARTEVDPALLGLLADPQWQPVVVFPGEFVAAERVVAELPPLDDKPARRPLFVLLDATWPEARKMFRKSPYLDHLPVLNLQAEQISRYKLRRSRRDDHFCTSEVVADTFAFGWARTEVDPALLGLLTDPQWQPVVVFPGKFVAAERVVTALPKRDNGGKRPLFVLLDATWPEARKMFRKSPYLNHLPVLSLQAEQISRYKLRRSRRDDHFCTSEVAALCLDLAGEPLAAQTLEAYLDVFTDHYLQAKNQLPVDLGDAAHQRLHALQLLQR